MPRADEVIPVKCENCGALYWGQEKIHVVLCHEYKKKPEMALATHAAWAEMSRAAKEKPQGKRTGRKRT